LIDVIERVGIGNLELNDGSAALRNNAIVDLGAIAKGYALNEIDGLLDDLEISSALINLGGSVLAKGRRADGTPWRVGIAKPFGTGDELLGIVEAADICIVTAGVSQRSFMKDGRLYHHILDPRTGMPADTDVWSATIIMRNGAWADVYSTICVLKGAAEAMTFVESIEGVECVLALADGSIVVSQGVEFDSDSGIIKISD
jgi:thiamine biosynthesis lipoprotein